MLRAGTLTVKDDKPPIVKSLLSRSLLPASTSPPLSIPHITRRDLLRELQHLRADTLTQPERALEIVGADNLPVSVSEQSFFSFSITELPLVMPLDTRNPNHPTPPLPHPPQAVESSPSSPPSIGSSSPPSSCTSSALLYTPVESSGDLGGILGGRTAEPVV